MFTYLALVSPPVALAIDVFARSLPEIGRADDEDLEALRPGLVASPRTGRDALIAQAGFLELERLGRRAVRRLSPSFRPLLFR